MKIVLEKLSRLFKKKPRLVTQEMTGILVSKNRIANQPKSYSLYMPQSMLNSAYKEDKARYDLFYVTLSGHDPISLPEHLWDDLEVGKNYMIKANIPNPELGFIDFLNQIENISYDIKELK